MDFTTFKYDVISYSNCAASDTGITSRFWIARPDQKPSASDAMKACGMRCKRLANMWDLLMKSLVNEELSEPSSSAQIAIREWFSLSKRQLAVESR
jgi:hypothetical protein